MRARIVFACAMISALGLRPLSAQVPVPRPSVDPFSEPTRPVEGAAPAVPASAEPAKPDPMAEAANKKAQRLQKIQQLKFDRRPSAILQAWSTPPDTETASIRSTLS